MLEVMGAMDQRPTAPQMGTVLIVASCKGKSLFAKAVQFDETGGSGTVYGNRLLLCCAAKRREEFPSLLNLSKISETVPEQNP
jgi:hypothetical protein